jgi:hypothetical protein
VSEFPDVFPKDLPGMSPERKVEFAIELLPRTAPISKRAYRVSVTPLVLRELQIWHVIICTRINLLDTLRMHSLGSKII